MPTDRTVTASAALTDPTFGYTRFCLLPVGLTVVFEGLAWLTGDIWLHVLAALCAATVLAACLDDPRVAGLAVEIEHPTATTDGATSTHRFTVTNNGRRTTSAAHLRHHAHGLADVSILLPRLSHGQSTTVTVPRQANGRGVTPGHVVLVTSSSPYGLRRTLSKARLMTPLVVRPRLVPAPLIRPRELDEEDSALSVVRRDGPVVRGLREWRSGDDARQVHWRSTARRGKLVVVEREAPQRPRVTLLAINSTGRARWEPAVSALASVAVQSVRAGDEVSLWADQPGLQPLRGATTDTLLDWCAALSEPTSPTAEFVQDVAGAAGRGGVVHVVAPDLDVVSWDHLRHSFAQRGVGVVDVAGLPGPHR